MAFLFATTQRHFPSFEPDDEDEFVVPLSCTVTAIWYFSSFSSFYATANLVSVMGAYRQFSGLFADFKI